MPITKDINHAVQELNQGGVVAIPTETVYGLAGNAFDEVAIAKVFALKGRPLYNPLIVHLASADALHNVAEDIPESALRLAKKFWPGPLTMILKKKPHIPDLVTANKDTVAVRVPNHSLTLALLQQLAYPLAAPSANPFGRISPTSAEHVDTYFKNELAVILDGGPCQQGIESTIIGFDGDRAILYRHGSLDIAEIEQCVGPLTPFTTDDHHPNAPGMLSKHYAPKTKTILSDQVEELLSVYANQRVGVLTFQKRVDHPAIHHQEVLSPTGDFNEAARNLYAAMHRLDKIELDLIIAERLPNNHLGKSINDRLQRAANNH